MCVSIDKEINSVTVDDLADVFSEDAFLERLQQAFDKRSRQYVSWYQYFQQNDAPEKMEKMLRRINANAGVRDAIVHLRLILSEK